MSRSYKKSPVYKAGSDRSKARKFRKKRAEQKVRRCQTAFRKSNEYRKIYESWDICDYRFYQRKPDDAQSEELEHWKRYYYRK